MRELLSLDDRAGIATVVVCGLIVLAAAIGAIVARRQFIERRPSNELTRSIPAVLVSLGIFGTFLGIFLGLLDFDVSRLDASVPALLEGLKTAFITSLFGMAFGLCLRLYYGDLDRRRATTSRATTDDPIELLRSIATSVQSAERTTAKVGETLVKCFRADDDYSLVSQLKLIRSDMNDLKKEVTRSLDEFGKKVAELGTEALVNSLREVIEQFNVRLNDLVGAEFKQLKEAMVKLVEWQQQYRASVDEMQRQLLVHLDMVQRSSDLLVAASQSLERSSEHLDSIDGSLASLSVTAADIEAHVKAIHAQNQALAALVTEVHQLGVQAQSVLPSLTTHLNEATTELASSGRQLREDLKANAEETRAVVESVGKSLDDLVKKHDEHVVKTVRNLESGLEQTLNQSLASLGGQLAALSAKFVQDYTPLTERLRAVVRLAEGRHDVPQA